MSRRSISTPIRIIGGNRAILLIHVVLPGKAFVVPRLIHAQRSSDAWPSDQIWLSGDDMDRGEKKTEVVSSG